ncbi:Protein kinase-like domain containing protein [Elaphomyces granulatus]
MHLLLIMSTNRKSSMGVQDDDAQDHIGSNDSTPSGIATPRPNPADKRLPSIMHYFSQVGSSSAFQPSSCNVWSFSSMALSMVNGVQSTAAHAVQREEDSNSNSSPSGAGINATRELERSLGAQSPALSVAGSSMKPEPEELLETFHPRSLPTPPHSFDSSLPQKEPEERENGGPGEGKGFASIYTARKCYFSSPVSVSACSPNRHASLPVSGVSDDPVLASHFSNPSLSHTPQPSSLLEAPSSDHERAHVSKSSENLAKLTEMVGARPQLKNTPPLTPRAMSNDNSHPEKRRGGSFASPSSSTSCHLADAASTTEELTGKLNAAFPSPSHTPQEGPAVALLKGRLSVRISEARGLRPSIDPYVVCVFEWNEYISKSAQGENNRVFDVKRAHRDWSDGDLGRPMAIPMKSRQSSNNSQLDGHDCEGKVPVTELHWNHEAVFDVLGDESDIDVSVYDRYNHEAFLGHVRLSLNLKEDKCRLEGWFPLVTRGVRDDHVSGEIHLEMHFEKTDKKQVGPNDFQILKLIGKGTFGQVYQVKKKDTQRIYAMKVLSKKVIIQKKEVQHTLGERNILVRTAMVASPFIVGLKFSFQTPTDLYLVTDYMSGGELFWHLQKEGRFPEGRAKFYIAELILALQHLHQHDIVYRDLKPENILLDANGHIALCDFGLSKANLTKNDTTNTFCGTTEYLAPEVLLDELGYTKMVDFWSLGVLVFEMCCGWSPFYAEDTQQMYKNIAFGKVRFPRDALSTEGRNFVKGLLNRNPKHRLGAKDDAQELMTHPFFDDIDWEALARKEVIPPFKPKLKSDTDTSNFDPEFTTALDHSTSLNDRAAALANGGVPTSTPLSPGMQANFKGFTFVNESSMDHHLKDNQVDRMDEDTRDDDTWRRTHHSGSSGDQRMSGVIRTGESGESGIFNNFDM